VENDASMEIRKKRGFPRDAWESVAQTSDAFPHFPQPRRRWLQIRLINLAATMPNGMH
jgi:hypothetical protein